MVKPGRHTHDSAAGTHPVLGTPLEGPWPDGFEVAYFALGCFWGAERLFWRMDGVHSTAVGYMGGLTPDPSYEEVCTSGTGHAETVRVVYDPTRVSFDALLATFWENHDPTTPNRQGNDVGSQYRSAVFTTTPAQLEEALKSKERYQRALSSAGFGTISTQILSIDRAGDGRFYLAEDYHQAYLHRNPGGYCNHGFCQASYE
jgi:peptide-methionine (S)-S-oxide reductase